MTINNDKINLIKKLREQTNISIAKCKTALEHNDYNLAKAYQYLCTTMATQVIRSESKTQAGKIFLYQDDEGATLVKIDTETDFATSSLIFNEAGHKIVQAIHNQNDSSVIDQIIQEATLKLGEKMKITYHHTLKGAITGAYIHNSDKAVLVSLNKGDANIAKNIAIHIASCWPIVALTEQDIDQKLIDNKIATGLAQIDLTKKSSSVKQRIIDGMRTKIINDNCLIFKPFYADDQITLKDYLISNNIEISDIKFITTLITL